MARRGAEGAVRVSLGPKTGRSRRSEQRAPEHDAGAEAETLLGGVDATEDLDADIPFFVGAEERARLQDCPDAHAAPGEIERAWWPAFNGCAGRGETNPAHQATPLARLLST
jgi:hypothetical protein